MQKGRFFKPLLIATVGLGILLLLNWLPLLNRPQSALASSFVIGSDPVDGSTINVPPTQMRIFFNTPLSPASTATIYYGINYQVMNAGRSHVASNNPDELDTSLLSQLPDGSYTVRWTALSATDGRATHGVIGFNIGHSSTGLPGQVILGPTTSNILPQLSSLGLLAIAWDWLVMAALALWIGILVMEGIVLVNGKDESGVRTTRDLRGPGASSNIDQSTSARLDLVVSENVGVGFTPVRTSTPPYSILVQVRKQSLPLQWLCLAALCVGEIINLLLRGALYTQTINTSGIDPAAIRALMLDTMYGHLWLVRFALIVLALVFLAWSNRSVRRRAIGLYNAAGTRVGEKTGSTISMLILAGFIVFTLALSEDITQLAQTHLSAVLLDWFFLIAHANALSHST